MKPPMHWKLTKVPWNSCSGAGAPVNRVTIMIVAANSKVSITQRCFFMYVNSKFFTLFYGYFIVKFYLTLLPWMVHNTRASKKGEFYDKRMQIQPFGKLR